MVKNAIKLYCLPEQEFVVKKELGRASSNFSMMKQFLKELNKACEKGFGEDVLIDDDACKIGIGKFTIVKDYLSGFTYRPKAQDAWKFPKDETYHLFLGINKTKEHVLQLDGDFSNNMERLAFIRYMAGYIEQLIDTERSEEAGNKEIIENNRVEISAVMAFKIIKKDKGYAALKVPCFDSTNTSAIFNQATAMVDFKNLIMESDSVCFKSIQKTDNSFEMFDAGDSQGNELMYVALLKDENMNLFFHTEMADDSISETDKALHLSMLIKTLERHDQEKSMVFLSKEEEVLCSYSKRDMAREAVQDNLIEICNKLTDNSSERIDADCIIRSIMPSDMIDEDFLDEELEETIVDIKFLDSGNDEQ